MRNEVENEQKKTIPRDGVPSCEEMRKTLELWYGRSTDLGLVPSPAANAHTNRGPWGPNGQGANLEEVEKQGW